MKLNMKNKIGIILIAISIVCAIYILYVRFGVEQENQPEPNNEISQGDVVEAVPEDSGKVDIVATMNDKISADASWCGTFQLVWNDMVNELVGQDVKFEEELAIVDNLNKQDFTEKDISEKHYYKKWGLKTLDLKAEIENGIKEKFGETSDILEDIDWSKEALDQGRDDVKRYLFYTMLKREFSYQYEFSKLEDGKFADKYENVKYFGIDNSTEEKVGSQVEVLYYNSEDDCAVILNTVEGDRVILCKGTTGTTFNEIYNEMMSKSDSFDGMRSLDEKDLLRVPEISFDVKKEYTELQNKKFYSVNGDELEIMKALQSIEMKLDAKGGSVKSEAAIDVMEKLAMPIITEQEPRNFAFDEEYTVFLVEAGKQKPYFATNVCDITKFQ